MSHHLLQRHSPQSWWEAAANYITVSGLAEQATILMPERPAQPLCGPLLPNAKSIDHAPRRQPFAQDDGWGACLPIAASHLLYAQSKTPLTGQQMAVLELVANLLALRLTTATTMDASAVHTGAPTIVTRQQLQNPYPEIVGDSPLLLEVLGTVDKIAGSNVPVLIQGESGTGKELIARAIHQYGKRRQFPFVSENCAAIPESLLESELFGYTRGSFTGAYQDKQGLFEMADKGTLFLDEVGDMSLNMQKKLLRTLQNGEIRAIGGKSVKKVDVRVVTASNKDLKQMVGNGSFREDLFYRLHVVAIHLPPLRRRGEDVLLLFDYFVRKNADKLGVPAPVLSEEVRHHLLTYPWPGNIRELQNEVQRIMALLDGARIEASMLSPEIAAACENKQ